MMLSETLVKSFPIISEQVNQVQLGVLLQELEHVLRQKLEGDIVEFGCYCGTTSLFIQRLLKAYNSDKMLHVYDSFEGLPEKNSYDQSAAGQQFKAGELSFSKNAFIKNFKKADVTLPAIHKNWFADLKSNDVPNKICFAFLDGDYYDSIMQSLKLIWQNLAPGAVIVVDDYQNVALPGAAKAIDDWSARNSVTRFRVQSNLAILRT